MIAKQIHIARLTMTICKLWESLSKAEKKQEQGLPFFPLHFSDVAVNSLTLPVLREDALEKGENCRKPETELVKFIQQFRIE